MSRLVVVSNRVALPDNTRPVAGGLSRALEDALRTGESLWFGWDGKISDEEGGLESIENGRVTYVTTSLNRKEYADYYCGFANEVLWPAFHYRLDLIRYDAAAYRVYRDVNRRLARTLSTLLRPDDVLWIHDYHFIPFAAMCRELGITNRIGFFLHIPFPAAEIFGALPCSDELLEDFAAYDLVGFHTEGYRRAFQAFSDERNAPGCRTGVYPVGIPVDDIRYLAQNGRRGALPGSVTANGGTVDTIIGVDRLDYTKGLPERLDAYERFLQRYPDYQRRVRLLQVTPLSRAEIDSYHALRDGLERQVGHINGRYADAEWQPVQYLNATYDRMRLIGAFRHARVGLVTPLRDGMNLVAKEYVAAQDPADPGVLVLSRFAGAACAMTAALLVNPLDPGAVAEALARALSMPLAERITRHEALMKVLEESDISHWSRDFLGDLDAVPRAPEKRRRPEDRRQNMHGKEPLSITDSSGGA